MADRTGQRIDDYQLQRLLGQGTFGEVYLAEHLYKHTTVAVKVLTMQVDDEMLENFLREARTLFLLKHPNIVPLLDFGSEKKVPFLVIEYAPNGTLRQRHPQGERVPLSVVNSYVQQVASALQYAHDQRLIHCDVKPQNMLIGQDGRVMLGDFGVAAIAHSDHSMTAQQMAGTMAYVAPEQLQGNPRPASDQYALGICAYEWLCGVRPFTGSSWELMSQHAHTPPASLRKYVPDLPEAVEKAVLYALAKDRHERFASVTAFATALSQASQPVPPQFAGVEISWPRGNTTDRTPSWSEPSLPDTEPKSDPSLPVPGRPSSLSEPPMSVFDAPTVATPNAGEIYVRPQQASAFDLALAQQSQPSSPPMTPATPTPFPNGYPAMPPPGMASSGSMPAIRPSQLPSPRPGDGDALRSFPPPQQGAVAPRTWSQGKLLALGAVILVLLVGILTPVLILHNQQGASSTAKATATAQAQAQATQTAINAAYQNWVNTNGIMFGFDHAHTHWNLLEHTLAPGNVARLRVLWTYGVNNIVTAAPAVANGIVYESTQDGKLYAFNANCRSACQPLWSYAIGYTINSSPAIANGMVYIGSDNYKLYAFDATCRSACQPLWSYATGAPIYSSPVVANGVVFIGSDDHKIYAFDASCRSTCQPLWSFKTGGGIDSSPAVANGILYFGADNSKLFAFDATCRSGCQPLWSYQTGGFIVSSPAIADGLMYVGSDDGKLYAFNANCRSACQPLWSYSAGKRIRSSPAIANGLVYVGADDGKLYVFAGGCRSACQPLWSYTTGGGIDGSPTVANGVVYVGSHDNKLYAFNANCRSACQPLWSFKTYHAFYSPTVANGVVYVGSGDHRIYAFGL